MLEQGYCIRLSTDDDGEAICALMRRAFDYGDGSNAALTTAWWRWKYFANPAGRYSIVCEGPDGRLLGHYGGTPSRVWSDGRVMTFGQNCDSCTDPDVRRGLRNPGLFVRLAQAYASTFSGSGDNALMYGLPIRSAHRIGARYLDYWLLRSQLGLVLDDLTSLPALDGGLVVESVTTLPADLDAFLVALRPSYRCHAERSSAFLRWRFLTHPNTTYQIAVVRRAGSGELRGYVVYRPSDFLGRGLGLLMDLMVLPRDDAALAALLRWVCERAVADGRRGLFGLGAPPQPWFRRLQDWGFRVETTPYVLAARPYAVIDPAYLREHWFYTLADYDIL
jgi:hypothetical protein